MFKLIVDRMSPPALDVDAPFTFLATLLDRDNFAWPRADGPRSVGLDQGQ
jgi:predicted membrane GTPase involved in stress response